MEEEKSAETLSVVPAEDNSYELSAVSKEKIKKESQEILAKIIEETDYTKTKDLTVLFNINQTKKTMARVNKLNELLDVITDNAIQRFTEKPDNFSNRELLQGLKVVQDMVEKSQKQIRRRRRRANSRKAAGTRRHPKGKNRRRCPAAAHQAGRQFTHMAHRAGHPPAHDWYSPHNDRHPAEKRHHPTGRSRRIGSRLDHRGLPAIQKMTKPTLPRILLAKKVDRQ